MRNITRNAWVGGLAALVLALGGCGGGGGGYAAPVATDQVPPEAVASTPALAAFLKALPASDTAEPLRLAGAVPPTSETEEPAEID